MILGNRKGKAFADGTAETYGYDELSRLTTARPGGRMLLYEYDAVGNRRSMTDSTAPGTHQTTYHVNDFNAAFEQ